MRFSSLRLAGLCAACSFLPSLAVAAKPSVPDWVRDAAHHTIPAYAPETNAVVLLDETTYTVAPNGQATEHYRRVVKILRPQGRRDARVEVGYDRDTPLQSLHIWSIGPDGREYALKDNEIVDVSSFGQGNLYEDDRAKIAEAPGADPAALWRMNTSSASGPT